MHKKQLFPKILIKKIYEIKKKKLQKKIIKKILKNFK